MVISYEFVQCEFYENVQFLGKKHEGPPLTPPLNKTAMKQMYK